MKSRPASYYFLVFGALLALPGCHSSGGAAPVACRIDGPPELMPAVVAGLRTGISRAQLQRRLGPADYSPADGTFYFSTGGDCPLGEVTEPGGHNGDEPGRSPTAACGLVADFNDRDGNPRRLLQNCWWGAIAE